MIDRISISIEVSDDRLRSSLLLLFEKESELCLSEENIPYPEEIIITDESSYIQKTGEIFIAVGFEMDSAYTCTSKDPEEILSATKRAVCYWDTANMNRTSVNSFITHHGLLEEIAGKLLDSIHGSDLSTEVCKAIVSDMPISLILIDGSGYISMMNNQAQDFFKGYDVKPLSRLAEIVLPDELNDFLSEEAESPTEIFLEGRKLTLKKFKVSVSDKAPSTAILFY